MTSDALGRSGRLGAVVSVFLSPDRFVDAWAAWDARPDAARATAFEDECKRAARAFDLEVSTFRDWLTAFRRGGLSRPEALSAVAAVQASRSRPEPF